MDTTVKLALVIFLAPLATFVVMALFHKRIPRHGDWLATGVMGLGLLCSIGIIFMAMGAEETFFVHWSFDWLPYSAASDAIRGGILLDGLTATMLFVVTLVSFLVHLFSIGYLKDDIRYGRYFASLLLFSTSMLGLVLADNLFLLFIFWELVGLSSYILIGHWFEKKSASDAAFKAFIVTRIGDVGMLLGLLICWWQVGSFDYGDIFRAAGGASFSEIGAFGMSWQTLAGLGLFFGAMGKSAQFPLHVWLPDAMEGPTPVSALIHAATMVAAGVYLIGRLFPIFTPTAFLVIAYIGAITAIFAATIATVQDDIKRVLAYSTLSQLGYMVLALGVGGYFAGLYHLTTHAFFKAGLFLGSGSVIYAMHHEQRMSKYGGLWSKMPITAPTYLICVLAISGVPLFAGFYSKDAILAEALYFSVNNPTHWFLAVSAFVTALMTAYYMFRQFFMTFTGKPRDAHAFEHARESPRSMTVPLIVLSSLAVLAGMPLACGDNFKEFLPPHEREAVIALYDRADAAALLSTPDRPIQIAAAGGDVSGFFAQEPAAEQEPVAAGEAEADEHAEDEEHGFSHEAAHNWAMILSILLAGSGIAIACAFFWDRSPVRLDPEAWRRAFPFNVIHPILWNKYFFDEIYGFIFVGGTIVVMNIMAWFDKWIVDGIVNLVGLTGKVVAFAAGIWDNWIVDGLVNGSAAICQFAGEKLSYTTTGRIRNYLLFVTIGVVGLTATLYLVMKFVI